MVRAAVIGIGRIGYGLERDRLRSKPASHVGAYLECPKTELVGVSDVDDAKLGEFKREHPDIAAYGDYETMLNRERPEIVSVCTPIETHAKIVRNAARFEPTKVIFCEKPIASTVEEAEKMIRTCEQFGVKLGVHLTRRWDPAYRLIKQILDGGWRSLPMSCVRGAQTYRNYSRWNMEELLAFDGRFSGGKIGDGVHMVDLYNWYRQENTELSLLNVPTPYLVFEFDLIGSEGWIKIRDNGAKIQLWKPRGSHRYVGLKELEHAADLALRYEFSRAMLNAVDDMVECASGDKQPDCTGRDGLETLRLCLEVFK